MTGIIILLTTIITFSIFAYYGRQKERTKTYWIVGSIFTLIGSVGIAYVLTYILFAIFQY